MKQRSFIRAVSAVLSLFIILENTGFAAESISGAQLSFASSPKLSISLPKSIATMGEVFDANRLEAGSSKPEARKTIYLIQDAHMNESGQLNISKVLDQLIREKKVKFVFLEGGFGNNSAASIRDKASLAKRKEVAAKYLKQGVLDASEYLDITSNLDFISWGVENWDLYWKSVKTYADVVKNRQVTSDYLNQMGAAIEILKPRLYNPSLLAFDKKRESYFKEQLSVAEYINILLSETKLHNLAITHFPHLNALSKLKSIEADIDFQKANEEQSQAVRQLSQEDQMVLAEAFNSESNQAAQKISSGEHKTQKAYFALLQEKVKNLNNFPNLSRYLSYLQESEKIDAGAVLFEQKVLEKKLFETLAKTSDERELARASDAHRFLRSLFQLTVTPEEYKEYLGSKSSWDVRALTGFLNRKIMDLDQFYEKVVFLEGVYDQSIEAAEKFYELTLERDKSFVSTIEFAMNETKESQAAFIAGGYHTPNLSALLKERGISFAVITPQILKETNQKRYEERLLGQKTNDVLVPEGADTPVAAYGIKQVLSLQTPSLARVVLGDLSVSATPQLVTRSRMQATLARGLAALAVCGLVGACGGGEEAPTQSVQTPVVETPEITTSQFRVAPLGIPRTYDITVRYANGQRDTIEIDANFAPPGVIAARYQFSFRIAADPKAATLYPDWLTDLKQTNALLRLLADDASSQRSSLRDEDRKALSELLSFVTPVVNVGGDGTFSAAQYGMGDKAHYQIVYNPRAAIQGYRPTQILFHPSGVVSYGNQSAPFESQNVTPATDPKLYRAMVGFSFRGLNQLIQFHTVNPNPKNVEVLNSLARVYKNALETQYGPANLLSSRYQGKTIQGIDTGVIVTPVADQAAVVWVQDFRPNGLSYYYNYATGEISYPAGQMDRTVFNSSHPDYAGIMDRISQVLKFEVDNAANGGDLKALYETTNNFNERSIGYYLNLLRPAEAGVIKTSDKRTAAYQTLGSETRAIGSPDFGSAAYKFYLGNDVFAYNAGFGGANVLTLDPIAKGYDAQSLTQQFARALSDANDILADIPNEPFTSQIKTDLETALRKYFDTLISSGVVIQSAFTSSRMTGAHFFTGTNVIQTWDGANPAIPQPGGNWIFFAYNREIPEKSLIYVVGTPGTFPEVLTYDPNDSNNTFLQRAREIERRLEVLYNQGTPPMWLSDFRSYIQKITGTTTATVQPPTSTITPSFFLDIPITRENTLYSVLGPSGTNLQALEFLSPVGVKMLRNSSVSATGRIYFDPRSVTIYAPTSFGEQRVYQLSENPASFREIANSALEQLRRMDQTNSFIQQFIKELEAASGARVGSADISRVEGDNNRTYANFVYNGAQPVAIKELVGSIIEKEAEARRTQGMSDSGFGISYVSTSNDRNKPTPKLWADVMVSSGDLLTVTYTQALSSIEGSRLTITQTSSGILNIEAPGQTVIIDSENVTVVNSANGSRLTYALASAKAKEVINNILGLVKTYTVKGQEAVAERIRSLVGSSRTAASAVVVGTALCVGACGGGGSDAPATPPAQEEPAQDPNAFQNGSNIRASFRDFGITYSAQNGSITQIEISQNGQSQKYTISLTESIRDRVGAYIAPAESLIEALKDAKKLDQPADKAALTLLEPLQRFFVYKESVNAMFGNTTFEFKQFGKDGILAASVKNINGAVGNNETTYLVVAGAGEIAMSRIGASTQNQFANEFFNNFAAVQSSPNAPIIIRNAIRRVALQADLALGWEGLLPADRQLIQGIVVQSIDPLKLASSAASFTMPVVDAAKIESITFNSGNMVYTIAGSDPKIARFSSTQDTTFENTFSLSEPGWVVRDAKPLEWLTLLRQASSRMNDIRGDASQPSPEFDAFQGQAFSASKALQGSEGFRWMAVYQATPGKASPSDFVISSVGYLIEIKGTNDQFVYSTIGRSWQFRSADVTTVRAGDVQDYAQAITRLMTAKDAFAKDPFYGPRLESALKALQGASGARVGSMLVATAIASILWPSADNEAIQTGDPRIIALSFQQSFIDRVRGSVNQLTPAEVFSQNVATERRLDAKFTEALQRFAVKVFYNQETNLGRQFALQISEARLGVFSARKDGEVLVLDIQQGSAKPVEIVRVQNPAEVLRGLQREAGMDRSTAIGASDVMAMLRTTMLLAEPMLTKPVTVPVALVTPVSLSADITDPAEFRASVQQQISQPRYFTQNRPGQKIQHHYLTGTELLADTQRQVLAEVVKGLTDVTVLEKGQAVSFEGVLIQLVDTTANNAITSANTVNLGVGTRLSSGDVPNFVRYIAAAFGIIPTLASAYSQAKNAIDYGAVQAGQVPGEFVGFVNESLVDRGVQFTASDALQMLPGTDRSLLQKFAMVLPAIKKLALNVLVAAADMMRKAVGMAA